MKILTIVGARPQFIKAVAVSRAINSYNKKRSTNINEVILHTGQHYDDNMSKVFFSELDIPSPNYNLGISKCSHGAMTGRMLEKIERILLRERPDLVLVYGDTNSTLAGAIAAAKLSIPLAHIEAGLRSFNMNMPEEINRIITDRVSKLLFCPTENAVENLAKEGLQQGVLNVGDVMYDVTLFNSQRAKEQVPLSRWNIKEDQYVLCTIHRAENTDSPDRLHNIFNALKHISASTQVILPLHPRTRKILSETDMLHVLDSLITIEPVSYIEMLRLEMSAEVILTDSGGVQKEAFFHKVPCLTLREETEWIETVTLKVNTICGADQVTILDAWQNACWHASASSQQPYGNGNSAEKIVKHIVSYFN